MIETRAESVPAERIESPAGHITHRAACPFCRKLVVDCDGAATGCWHVRELEINRDHSQFLFEAECEHANPA